MPYTCNKCSETFKNKKLLNKHYDKEHGGKDKMANITINIPENYDYNIQKLIKMKLLPSRSEAIRTALREFLNREYNKNLELLEFFDWNKQTT